MNSNKYSITPVIQPGQFEGGGWVLLTGLTIAVCWLRRPWEMGGGNQVWIAKFRVFNWRSRSD